LLSNAFELMCLFCMPGTHDQKCTVVPFISTCYFARVVANTLCDVRPSRSREILLESEPVDFFFEDNVVGFRRFDGFIPICAGTFFGRQVGVWPWTVPWDNWLAWVKHGGPEAIEIGLGDTHEVYWLGDGSTLHVVELEEFRDHHLVVERQ
jgi:hypothetical protein